MGSAAGSVLGAIACQMHRSWVNYKIDRIEGEEQRSNPENRVIPMILDKVDTVAAFITRKIAFVVGTKDTWEKIYRLEKEEEERVEERKRKRK
jgi:hypothetical protein